MLYPKGAFRTQQILYPCRLNIISNFRCSMPFQARTYLIHMTEFMPDYPIGISDIFGTNNRRSTRKRDSFPICIRRTCPTDTSKHMVVRTITELINSQHFLLPQNNSIIHTNHLHSAITSFFTQSFYIESQMYIFSLHINHFCYRAIQHSLPFIIRMLIGIKHPIINSCVKGKFLFRSLPAILYIIAYINQSLMRSIKLIISCF